MYPIKGRSDLTYFSLDALCRIVAKRNQEIDRKRKVNELSSRVLFLVLMMKWLFTSSYMIVYYLLPRSFYTMSPIPNDITSAFLVLLAFVSFSICLFIVFLYIILPFFYLKSIIML